MLPVDLVLEVAACEAAPAWVAEMAGFEDTASALRGIPEVRGLAPLDFRRVDASVAATDRLLGVQAQLIAQRPCPLPLIAHGPSMQRHREVAEGWSREVLWGAAGEPVSGWRAAPRASGPGPQSQFCPRSTSQAPQDAGSSPRSECTEPCCPEVRTARLASVASNG